MTNKEIAAWMGISERGFNTRKKEYLKELDNNYFKYHLEGKRMLPWYQLLLPSIAYSAFI